MFHIRTLRTGRCLWAGGFISISQRNINIYVFQELPPYFNVKLRQAGVNCASIAGTSGISVAMCFFGGTEFSFASRSMQMEGFHFGMCLLFV